MSKYIKKKDLKRAIGLCTLYHINENGKLVVGAGLENKPLYKESDINRIIKELPTRKVKDEERVHGEWIFDDPISADFMCSECLERNDICTSFCPNCGADMRGAK